ncbi:LexA family transcriptional regulator [Burkholderia cepacia]|uniref:LexA family transcriptional regulator n=1 Tax=Burkholderia cepacia TaxID=292 RepID=UPI001CF128EF|nr:LexA family transcriptional regulator [Burkholderia cepacia]MCA8331863.1 LexA family transcriptional regulator [Burkholderia cepacia]
MSQTYNFLVSNLQLLMLRRGLNPNSLAERLNNKPPQATIFRIISGESATPRDSTLQPIADFFGISVKALRYQNLAVTTPLIPTQQSKRMFPMAKVFVVRIDQRGLPNSLWDREGNLIEHSEQYARIATEDPRAFLIVINDAALEPRYFPGEYVLVEPEYPPELEDDVIVCLLDGTVLIRRLVSRRNGIRLGTYRMIETESVASDKIAWMYAISDRIAIRRIKEWDEDYGSETVRRDISR